MLQKDDLGAHPLYLYAEFAFSTIQARFPQGMGNRVDPAIQYNESIIVQNLLTFKAFSESSKPNALDYAQIIANLKSGNADILACYALGSLYLQYPEQKSLFQLLYVTQTIPGIYNDQTHVLLLIGAPEDVTIETLFQYPDSLVCDFSSNDIYLTPDFHKRQNEKITQDTWFLLFNMRTMHYAGLIRCAIQNLNGSLRLMPKVAVEEFYNELESMVHIDKGCAQSNSLTRRIEKLHSQSIFTKSPEEQRKIWEAEHSRIVGYVTDHLDICHTIHRIYNTKKYAYWNSQTNAPVSITFKKIDGIFISDLGPLSASTPLQKGFSG